MAIRRTDIDIIIPSATYQQKNDIPVWDAYIEKVVIDGDIPSLISDIYIWNNLYTGSHHYNNYN